MSLVHDLGANYMNDFFQGALFIYDNRVYRFGGCDSRTIGATDMENNMSAQLPASEFVGFRNFQYPVLGYRRFAPDYVAWCTRRHGTNRGLRLNHIDRVMSPLTNKLVSNGAIPIVGDREASRAIMLPVYDGADAIQELLNGDRANVLLSNNLLIEPSVQRQDDWYSVYFKNATIGTMNSRGVCTFVDPKYNTMFPELSVS